MKSFTPKIKWIIFCTGFFIVLAGIYFCPFKLKTFFSKNYNYDTFDSVTVEEILEVGNSHKYKLTDPAKIDKIVEVLQSCTVRRSVAMPKTFDVKPYCSYIFLFEKIVGDTRKGLYISIYPLGNSMYLNISTGVKNGEYKIVGKKDFKIISEILSQ